MLYGSFCFFSRREKKALQKAPPKRTPISAGVYSRAKPLKQQRKRKRRTNEEEEAGESADEPASEAEEEEGGEQEGAEETDE